MKQLFYLYGINIDKISSSDIDEAIDRVIGGPAKKTKVISERTKRMVAYHEAGLLLLA